MSGAVGRSGTWKRESAESRFWARVTKTDTCWLWRAAPSKTEHYGALKVDGQTSGMSAHRFSWILANGPIPDGLCVLHKCDVKLCVNPSHLFLGTLADNNADKKAKGRQPKGSTHGNNTRLTEADIIAIRADTRKLTEIGGDYGLTKSHVSSIKTRRSWKHI